MAKVSVTPEQAAAYDRLLETHPKVERKGKKLDLKKLVTRVETGEEIDLSIAWTERGTARPEDLLKALGRDPADCRIRKTGMTFTSSLGETIRKTNDA